MFKKPKIGVNSIYLLVNLMAIHGGHILLWSAARRARKKKEPKDILDEMNLEMGKLEKQLIKIDKKSAYIFSSRHKRAKKPKSNRRR